MSTAPEGFGSYISVKNFEKFQHYNSRTPPWIKLYNDLLDDYEFACLPDVSKSHLMMIWLLASRYKNRVPNDAAWIKNRINANEAVDIQVLITAGFIELAKPDKNTAKRASKTLATRKQVAMLEIEREIEGEKDNSSDIDASGTLFELAKQRYPRRSGVSWPDTRKQWDKRVKEGHAPTALLNGADRYAAYVKAEGTEERFMKLPATFYGPGRHWESVWTPKPQQGGSNGKRHIAGIAGQGGEQAKATGTDGRRSAFVIERC